MIDIKERGIECVYYNDNRKHEVNNQPPTLLSVLTFVLVNKCAKIEKGEIERY